MSSKRSSTNSSLALTDELQKISKAKSIKSLREAGIKTIQDILWIFPLRVETIPKAKDFSTASIDSFFTGVGKVLRLQRKNSFQARGKSKVPLINVTATVQDHFSKETMILQWFNTYPSIYKKIQENKELIFVGKCSLYNGMLQIVNPDIHEADLLSIDPIYLEDRHRLVYPTVNKVSGEKIKKIIDKLPLTIFDQLDDIVPFTLLEQRSLPSLKDAFLCMHNKNESKCNFAIERIIYQEFIEEQIKIILRRSVTKEEFAPVIESNDTFLNLIYENFPYQLTQGQLECIEDIRKDFLSQRPMMRLIQGDVGSGKTTVALIAAVLVQNSGAQSAFMCPTETLASQHFETISKSEFGKDLNPVLLVGSLKTKERKLAEQKIASGEAKLVIGTHALFSNSVEYSNLQLAIIDEQHRFGVNQRLELKAKNRSLHTLMMTATPIPRSLSLTQYGDLDISIIATMPKGRKGVKSRIVGHENYENYLSFLLTRLEMGEQAYLVVPAIEESETLELEHVEKTILEYRKFFPNQRIEALHGKMKPEDKEKIFSLFQEREIDMLISTTVIEVGINNQNATVMSILNPERFGLSSLHQLRGRVGRGELPGFFFMVPSKELTTSALKRLSVIEKTTDGFEIAEEDLLIRGEGDLFGEAQSGENRRKVANIVLHFEQLKWARSDIEKIEFNPSFIDTLPPYLREDLRILTSL